MSSVSHPVVEYKHYSDEMVDYEVHTVSGLPHRVDGPAVILYDDKGQVQCKTYYENGKKHRTDGPAEILYDVNGKIYRVIYYENDNKHRIGGPAYIEYDKYGTIVTKMYFKNGKSPNVASSKEIYIWEGSAFESPYQNRPAYLLDFNPAEYTMLAVDWDGDYYEPAEIWYKNQFY